MTELEKALRRVMALNGMTRRELYNITVSIVAQDRLRQSHASIFRAAGLDGWYPELANDGDGLVAAYYGVPVPNVTMGQIADALWGMED